MPLTCAAPDPGSPIFESLAAYVDCHAQALGENGYRALAGGFIGPALLTSGLTIYVALIGYRVLLGQTIGVREAVFAALRIGLVITFCSQWPSYEAVIYRLVTDAPGEIASSVLQSSDLPTFSIGGTADRLQADYDAIRTRGGQIRLPVIQGGAPLQPGVSGAQASPSVVSAAGAPAPAQGGLSNTGLVLMISSMGGLLAVRLAAGVLLALGPLILVLALFDSTIGFVEGWIRALAAVSLSAAGVMVIVTLELAFIEAELAATDPTVASALAGQGLMVVAIMFAIAIVGMIIAAGTVAWGFKLPRWRMDWRFGADALSRPKEQPQSAQSSNADAYRPPLSSRAQAVADAAITQGRRDQVTFAVPARQTSAPPARPDDSRRQIETISRSQALGYSLRQSPASRRRAMIVRR